MKLSYYFLTFIFLMSVIGCQPSGGGTTQVNPQATPTTPQSSPTATPASSPSSGSGVGLFEHYGNDIHAFTAVRKKTGSSDPAQDYEYRVNGNSEFGDFSVKFTKGGMMCEFDFVMTSSQRNTLEARMKNIRICGSSSSMVAAAEVLSDRVLFAGASSTPNFGKKKGFGTPYLCSGGSSFYSYLRSLVNPYVTGNCPDGWQSLFSY